MTYPRLTVERTGNVESSRGAWADATGIGAHARGASEFTRFDFRDLITLQAADILQPDLAIMGGLTEAVRIAVMADAFQLTVAPHLWGSALLFASGLQVAAATPNCTIVEYSLGFNPMLHELVHESPVVRTGEMFLQDRAGLGVTLNEAFVQHYQVTGSWSEVQQDAFSFGLHPVFKPHVGDRSPPEFVPVDPRGRRWGDSVPAPAAQECYDDSNCTGDVQGQIPDH